VVGTVSASVSANDSLMHGVRFWLRYPAKSLAKQDSEKQRYTEGEMPISLFQKEGCATDVEIFVRGEV